MAHHRSGSTSNSPPPASSKSAAARLPTVSSTSSAGGGNNTELRAQIRKEREASKTNVLGVTGGGAGHSVKRELSSSSSTASLAGTKQQASSSQHVDAAQPAQLDRRSSSSHLDGYMMAPPVQQAAPMSTASKRLSTGSAVAAAVRKLEEDAKARDAHHAVFSITRSGSTGSAKAPSARERRSTDEVILEGGVPESYDHSFGIETLSAAFSAKYYELANKCKSWERYAAQLRARAEALDIDNRILRETSDRQERHVVALEAENAVLRSQNEQREARAREVEDRLTHLEAHVAETAHRRHDNTSGTGSSQCASSPSPREHNSAYHSSNLATSSGERNRRGPTPLSSSEREQDHDQISQASIPQQQQQRAKRPLSMGPANDHYSHMQHSQTNTTIQPQYPAAQQQQHAYAPQAYPHLYQHPHAHVNALPHAALPKRRSVNSMDPDVVKTSASLPVLYLGSGGVARSRGMSVSSSLSEATMVAPPPGQPVRGMMPHVRSETVGPDCTAPAPGGGRRRLRRTSLNQQQQLAALQAQRDTSASSSSASVSSLNAARPPSRTASRMSVRTTRSRAGSATVHDSIPAVKDDMFSTSSASLSSGREAITHSQSQPLLSGNRNASNGSLGPPAATVGPHAHTIHLAAAAGQRGHAPLMPLPQWTNVEGRAQYPASTSDGVLYGGQAHHHHLATTTSHPIFARTASSTSLGGSSILTRTSSSGEIALPKIEDGDEGSESAAAVVHDVVDKATLRRRDASEDDAAALTVSATSSPSATASTSATEEDKRGAHRRLYIALRSELDSTDLAKFERYVHRYDAMEIPIDGPRGLVNRVKKLLLLADPTLRGRPEDLRRRKGLAREFERIVRVDLGGTPKAAGGEEAGAAREATA